MFVQAADSKLITTVFIKSCFNFGMTAEIIFQFVAHQFVLRHHADIRRQIPAKIFLNQRIMRAAENQAVNRVKLRGIFFANRSAEAKSFPSIAGTSCGAAISHTASSGHILCSSVR